jgi:glutamine amidotransferase
MGNLRSVAKALEAAGAEVTVTPDGAELATQDALCVPGQGIFGRCMENLARSGLEDAVRRWLASEKPFLGICLGMQILFDWSAEGEGTAGLGVLSGKVERLPPRLTVPHIGWNTVNDEYFYFDHSYAAFPEDEAVVKGWCEHGARFAAWVATGSITGVQFHPEKSGAAGIALLRDWLVAA